MQFKTYISILSFSGIFCLTSLHATNSEDMNGNVPPASSASKPGIPLNQKERSSLSLNDALEIPFKTSYLKKLILNYLPSVLLDKLFEYHPFLILSMTEKLFQNSLDEAPFLEAFKFIEEYATRPITKGLREPLEKLNNRACHYSMTPKMAAAYRNHIDKLINQKNNSWTSEWAKKQKIEGLTKGNKGYKKDLGEANRLQVELDESRKGNARCEMKALADTTYDSPYIYIHFNGYYTFLAPSFGGIYDYCGRYDPANVTPEHRKMIELLFERDMNNNDRLRTDLRPAHKYIDELIVAGNEDAIRRKIVGLVEECDGYKKNSQKAKELYFDIMRKRGSVLPDLIELFETVEKKSGKDAAEAIDIVKAATDLRSRLIVASSAQ